MNPFIGELKNPFTKAKVVGENVDPDAYHRPDPGVERGNFAFVMTNSNLRQIAMNAHRWRLGYEDEDTKATEWGNLIDCMVLTPQHFDTRFAVRPAAYETKGMKCPICGSITDSQKCAKCKVAREEVTVTTDWSGNAGPCEDWLKAREGKQIVKPEDMQLAENAKKFVFGHQQAAAHINCSRKQVMVVGEYEDKETGLVIPCKSLLDLVPDPAHEEFGKVLADFKTTPCAAEWLWTKKVWERRSDMQGAFFMDLYVAATGEDRCDWWHVVQETPPPWETTVWPLSIDFVEIGRGSYLAALKKYCQCLKSDTWPGYSSALGRIQPLPYMLQ